MKNKLIYPFQQILVTKMIVHEIIGYKIKVSGFRNLGKSYHKGIMQDVLKNNLKFKNRKNAN